MAEREIINDFKENYDKVRELLDEENKNDPENSSKYQAREILSEMRDSIKVIMKFDRGLNKIKFDAMLGTVLLNIGTIDRETEELTASEKVLTEAVDLLLPNSSKPEIIITLLSVYNNLGILWSNRDKPEMAKQFFLKAKNLYDTFKCTMQLPIPIEHIINNTEESVRGDLMVLEKAHTLTLYHLAHAYGLLKEDLKSAICSHVTLKRQLQYSDYDPIDWALNSATLSQIFAEKKGFFQARNHLAAASMILEQYKEKLMTMDSNDEVHLAKLESYDHKSAHVCRCWAKYYLLLMIASREKLSNDAEKLNDAVTDMSNLNLEDDENIFCGGDIKNLIFINLDVSKYETKIGDQFLLTYEDAREAFLSCQNWLKKAKEYYKLEPQATDYIEITLDSSQSYFELAFFEKDDERRAKMHKRRVDMLEDLIKEVNPTYNLQYCRQIWYELGEAYSNILNIKLNKLDNNSGKPTLHALKKINILCEKSIENYDHFLSSVKDRNGKLPVKLDSELIRPVVNAYGKIGTTSMKRVAVDKRVQVSYVKKSYDSFKTFVDLCTTYGEAADVSPERFNLCQDMVDVLPIKIKRMEDELVK